MKFDIKRYSMFDNYTVESAGNNVSGVYDKLLRLTTKPTESYASDVLYLIPAIMEAVENTERSLDAIIMFREGGVCWKYVENDSIEHNPESAHYLQCWRLTVDHTKQNSVRLERVYLVGAARYSNVIVGM